MYLLQYRFMGELVTAKEFDDIAQAEHSLRFCQSRFTRFTWVLVKGG